MKHEEETKLNDEIKQLTELQVIDLQIAGLDEEFTQEAETVGKLQQTYDERQESIVELQEKIEKNDARRRELEAELADETGRIKERQSKMMQVQTNREYQSLLKEIEDAKKANKDREDEVVQVMEEVDSLSKILEEQLARSEGDEKSLAELNKKLETLRKNVEKKKKVVFKDRDSKSKGLDENLLSRYDILRERRNGRAVVGVTDGVCQGCFMAIPPQQYNEILRGEKMLNCPTCQRILFFQEEEKEAEEA